MGMQSAKRCLLVCALGVLLNWSASAVWINEFHYDNDGTDTGEFIEIAGLAGTDLSGWTIVLYNGSGGASYGSIGLSGSIPDLINGFGVVSIPSAGMQNGAPDGFALVDAGSSVVQFLSYEGAFQATSGPAIGMTSTDVGVAETSTTVTGASLQLTGDGSIYDDFHWSGPDAATPGWINAGQTFSSPGSGSGSNSSVPDGGGTLALLAVAVSGLALTSRKRR